MLNLGLSIMVEIEGKKPYINFVLSTLDYEGEINRAMSFTKITQNLEVSVCNHCFSITMEGL